MARAPFDRNRIAGVEDDPEPPRVIENYEPFEEHAAEHFARVHGEDYRYNQTTGKWMLWDNGVWIDDELKQAERQMRRMNARRRLAGDLNATAYGRLSKSSFSTSAMKSAMVHDTFSISQRHFDTNPFLVACPSGYVDLRTGEMHGHSRANLFSRRCSVDPAPEARNGQWDDFLDQTTKGAEGLKDYLQKFAGYCLTGLMNEEIMSFMYGPGGNGKGVFLKALTGVFGSYAIPAPIEIFMTREFKGHPTEIARLAGARLITASEPDEGGRWNMRFIKEWTGNEAQITARFMRQDEFTFEPIGKLLFVGNHKPDIGTVDDATSRRLRMLPFMNKPPIVDGKLKDKMKASHPAILRWVIDGAVRYFEEGHLRPPASVEGVTMSYLQDQDLVTHFLDQYTTRAGENFHILARDMKTALQIYGQINGVRAPSTTAVNKKLNDMGIATSNIRNHRGERCVKRVHLTQEMLDLIRDHRVKQGLDADGRSMGSEKVSKTGKSD